MLSVLSTIPCDWCRLGSAHHPFSHSNVPRLYREIRAATSSVKCKAQLFSVASQSHPLILQNIAPKVCPFFVVLTGANQYESESAEICLNSIRLQHAGKSKITLAGSFGDRSLRDSTYQPLALRGKRLRSLKLSSSIVFRRTLDPTTKR
jgi:hypothetical protein